MPKRLLDCCASDFRGFSKADLLESIQKSEGRVIACESIGTVQPLLGNVTNAEFAASMGADILLLNMFDVQHPVIRGLPETEPENVVCMLKKMTGRPIGINLEPVAEGKEGETDPSNNNFYVIANEGARGKYNVTKGTSTDPISNGATVLEAKFGTQSTVLTFELEKKNVTYSGEYKDTVPFNVSLVTPNP